ncbi:MAG: hypothetical protein SGI71_00955 [Verrucomicrobiota bacterium]|nr:hypothetical protein [Verrucomicrobiota bacterium]
MSSHFSEHPQNPRKHPALKEMILEAANRHLTDENLALIQQHYPDLAPRLEAAKEIRESDMAVIKSVVTEVFAQYPYEKFHDLANPKCLRDVRYVVSYATVSMVCNDPAWLDDKLLIWLKTILQAFDFPDRDKKAASFSLPDPELDKILTTLPVKTKSIYHCYYRLRREMESHVTPQTFALINPFLDQALTCLTEKY